jgi:hypothetical protein
LLSTDGQAVGCNGTVDSDLHPKENNVTQTSAAEIPPSKVELVERIKESFAAHEAVVAQCNQGELN